MKTIYLRKYKNKSPSFAIISECDFDEVKKHSWHLGYGGYAIGRVDNKIVYLHRFILGFPDGIVDHKNRVKLDNRRSNLRVVTSRDSVINRGLNRNNTSGYKGISWRKDRKKWRAYIVVNYKQTSLGLYEKLEDAVRRREGAEMQLYPWTVK